MLAAILSSNFGLLLLTFLPPILWLLFYLREDKRPEPKHLILLTFIGGMASALIALLAECVLVVSFSGSCRTGAGPSLSPLLLFLGISFIEEYVKYLPVKYLVVRRPDFDEPVDGMIYMMTSAMGFAALENVLFVLPVFSNSLPASLEIAANRFLGANLLHALSSGIVGFFLARAWFHPHRHHFIALGITFAALLHTAFNYLILMREAVPQGTFYIILLLATMAVMVFIDFERLKKSRNNP